MRIDLSLVQGNMKNYGDGIQIYLKLRYSPSVHKRSRMNDRAQGEIHNAAKIERLGFHKHGQMVQTSDAIETCIVHCPSDS